jgi:hypothetical protein
MSFITAALVLITGIIIAVWRAISGKQKREQQQKNNQWNKQLDDLMNAYKKYKKK